jgi:hypothetical protein
VIAERPAANIHEIYADMKEKFDSRRYAKASHLNTLLNNCHTEEDIDLGVEAIKGFRSSLSKIQISTGAAVVRACCRAGVADKALEIMKNKIEYGVFFSKSAYDYLIQYFYEKKEYESESFFEKQNSKLYFLKLDKTCMTLYYSRFDKYICIFRSS